jgi:nucleoside-diphosphate-sugar epimerase
MHAAREAGLRDAGRGHRSLGLLGTYVAAALEAGDVDVVGLDTKPLQATRAHVVVSILDLDALRCAFDGADVVVHLAAAANIGAGPPERIIDLNAKGSWCVLEAALAAGVRRVVMCSTDSVMGNTVWRDHIWLPERLPVGEDHPLHPADPYGLSKSWPKRRGAPTRDADSR